MLDAIIAYSTRFDLSRVDGIFDRFPRLQPSAFTFMISSFLLE